MNTDDDEIFGTSKLDQHLADLDSKKSAIKQFNKEHPENNQVDVIQRVIITKIDIPFGKLVMFLVKLIIAAVPAAIIASIFWWFIVIVILGSLSK